MWLILCLSLLILGMVWLNCEAIGVCSKCGTKMSYVDLNNDGCGEWLCPYCGRW